MPLRKCYGLTVNCFIRCSLVFEEFITTLADDRIQINAPQENITQSLIVSREEKKIQIKDLNASLWVKQKPALGYILLIDLIMK